MLDFWLWSYHTHYKATCKFKSFLNCQCMYNKAVTRKDILEERWMSSLCSLTWDCGTPWIKFTLWNIFVSIVYGMKFTRGNSPEVIVNLLASPTGFKVKLIKMSGVILTILHFFPPNLDFRHSLWSMGVWRRSSDSFFEQKLVIEPIIKSSRMKWEEGQQTGLWRWDGKVWTN